MADIGVEVVTIDAIVAERVRGLDEITKLEQEEKAGAPSLRTHILKAFQDNKEARETGGVNKLMLDSLRDYNGQYSPSELQKIRSEGGSEIFMNLPSTKVRAAISWIKDIILASKEDSFSVERTPVVDLPKEIADNIEAAVARDFENMLKQPEAAQQEGQPPQAAPTPADTIKEMQERRRDLYEAIQEELNKEASFAMKILDKKIKDQMKEGKWEKALSEVIDDFCIFPTAFLKGPIVTRKKKLVWENGEAVAVEDYVIMNKRVSPLDIYPAREAASVNDGNFIEHLRMSRKEVASLRNHALYDKAAIERVLENNTGRGYAESLDTNIEDEKAREELREDTYSANENVFHGLHFFGTAPAKLLREWGLEDEKLDAADEYDEIDIEAILIGSEIVKCVLNDDPLGRRPYYSASFQKRPGSIWGSAPPYLMRDVTRMCNACARSLDNNMALSSGPIMDLNIDRLADGQDVQQLRPRDIVQTTSDPMGGSGKAISFFAIPSIANELLAVYKDFEVKADDVTMIPRYAYGNERTGGAAQTASGLSMLLESASKGIKDAIRHIDEGIIIPRVEMEFYTMMLRGDLDFTGDINVIARGSQSLTLAGAEQMRRNEFLQTTANPIDQKIMGTIGRAEILRKMADDLGLGQNIIPNRQELKKMERDEAAAQGAPAPAVQAAQIQNETIKSIADQRDQLTAAEIKRKTDKDAADIQLRAMEQEQKARADATKAVTQLEGTKAKLESEEHRANQAIALSLETGDKANSV